MIITPLTIIYSIFNFHTYLTFTGYRLPEKWMLLNLPVNSKIINCFFLVLQNPNAFEIVDKKEEHPFIPHPTATYNISYLIINVMLLYDRGLSSHRPVCHHAACLWIHTLGPRHWSMLSELEALLWPISQAGRPTRHWFTSFSNRSLVGELWVIWWDIVGPPSGQWIQCMSHFTTQGSLCSRYKSSSIIIGYARKKGVHIFLFSFTSGW